MAYLESYSDHSGAMGAYLGKYLGSAVGTSGFMGDLVNDVPAVPPPPPGSSAFCDLFPEDESCASGNYTLPVEIFNTTTTVPVTRPEPVVTPPPDLPPGYGVTQPAPASTGPSAGVVLGVIAGALLLLGSMSKGRR